MEGVVLLAVMVVGALQKGGGRGAVVVRMEASTRVGRGHE
jgi:hypothetical protein